MTESTLKPANVEELSRLLAAASSKKQTVHGVDLDALNRVIQHTPEDMTVTVEAGITLAALQIELNRHRQWLPIDPPHSDRLTLRGLVDEKLSGPRRFGCGTIRDYVIGMTIVLADGTVIHSGGKVVKNVAGYDLMKLFIGARGSLGVVVEVTFKLRPLPESEKFVESRCASLDQANELIEAIIKSELTPIAFDLHNLFGTATVVLGFAGSREEVDWQVARANELGVREPSSLDYAAQFWTDASPVNRISVLPSKLIDVIRGLNGATFVARAGNGIVYHRGAPAKSQDNLPVELMRRVKDAYDPNHLFPEFQR